MSGWCGARFDKEDEVWLRSISCDKHVIHAKAREQLRKKANEMSLSFSLLLSLSTSGQQLMNLSDMKHINFQVLHLGQSAAKRTQATFPAGVLDSRTRARPYVLPTT